MISSKYLQLILLVFVLSSCFSARKVQVASYDSVPMIDKALNSWYGSSELDIILKFGTPDKKYVDNIGNKSIRFFGKTITSTSGMVLSNSMYSQSITSQNYIDFIFNSNGKVIAQRNNYPKYREKYVSTRYETKGEVQVRRLTFWAPIVGGVAAIVYLWWQLENMF